MVVAFMLVALEVGDAKVRRCGSGRNLLGDAGTT
jgi:hypothetical protein